MAITYKYQFSCPCGNTIRRNYVKHGSSIKCRKCGRQGEIIKSGCHMHNIWYPLDKKVQ